eukprot:m.88469 g.88469  ORF g.88469 m.88469 type:complete len:538 (-) comp9761_c0_seq1:117-1730(-)
MISSDHDIETYMPHSLRRDQHQPASQRAGQRLPLPSTAINPRHTLTAAATLPAQTWAPSPASGAGHTLASPSRRHGMHRHTPTRHIGAGSGHDEAKDDRKPACRHVRRRSDDDNDSDAESGVMDRGSAEGSYEYGGRDIDPRRMRTLPRSKRQRTMGVEVEVGIPGTYPRSHDGFTSMVAAAAPWTNIVSGDTHAFDAEGHTSRKMPSGDPYHSDDGGARGRDDGHGMHAFRTPRADAHGDPTTHVWFTPRRRHQTGAMLGDNHGACATGTAVFHHPPTTPTLEHARAAQKDRYHRHKFNQLRVSTPPVESHVVPFLPCSSRHVHDSVATEAGPATASTMRPNPHGLAGASMHDASVHGGRSESRKRRADDAMDEDDDEVDDTATGVHFPSGLDHGHMEHGSQHAWSLPCRDTRRHTQARQVRPRHDDGHVVGLTTRVPSVPVQPRHTVHDDDSSQSWGHAHGMDDDHDNDSDGDGHGGQVSGLERRGDDGGAASAATMRNTALLHQLYQERVMRAIRGREGGGGGGLGGLNLDGTG